MNRERRRFFERKKKMSETPCLAHFAGDRDKIVTTNATRTRFEATLWHEQSTNSTKSIPQQIIEGCREKFLGWRARPTSSSMGVEEISFPLVRSSRLSVYQPSSFGSTI